MCSGDYPENSHVVVRPNKKRFLFVCLFALTFYVFVVHSTVWGSVPFPKHFPWIVGTSASHVSNSKPFFHNCHFPWIVGTSASHVSNSKPFFHNCHFPWIVGTSASHVSNSKPFFHNCHFPWIVGTSASHVSNSKPFFHNCPGPCNHHMFVVNIAYTATSHDNTNAFLNQ